MVKFVYAFEEGHKDLKQLLGGKGANLAEMKKIGLPVPDGFTLTTEMCNTYNQNNNVLTDAMLLSVDQSIKELEHKTGKVFGSHTNPLLVSVRSGAAVSMPGMMDTVLNLGLNDETVKGLMTKATPVFALDAYRRFIQMFSDVVLHIPKYKFDRLTKKFDMNTEEGLRSLIVAYKLLVEKEIKRPFPIDVKEQLILSVKAVFDSWENDRAVIYRQVHDISHDLGTAVNIQAMVFGNYSDRSGTGVCFTRNPSNGASELYGEFLLNAQGEDVVAGIRTPQTMDHLKEVLPSVYKQLIGMTELLEHHYKDMQDIEFTIEEEKLFLLQTRTGKRTAEAAVTIAVDLVKEGVLSKKEALMRLDANQMDQLLHPTFSKENLEASQCLVQGLAASPGAATGKIYFEAGDVKSAAINGIKTLLVRKETSPEDIEGMIYANGILTSRGGMTSHAAVVARGMGKCCVAGCTDVVIDHELKTMTIGSKVFSEGDYLALDGTTGRVYDGYIEANDLQLPKAFEAVMTWSKAIKELDIRTNADSVVDAEIAVSFGAEGIGLCRTEHMFFEKNRIKAVRQLILADDYEQRAHALSKLLPYQEDDFYKLFKSMDNKPVTVRLLDPPLHEFLPSKEEDIVELASDMSKSTGMIKTVIENLSEVNPMLGHRGCRLGLTYPEIYNMQVEAIVKAALRTNAEGYDTKPEIMIPLVGFKSELSGLKNQLIDHINTIFTEADESCEYTIGTMIEVPRAAVTADEIATEAEFFSFGTNDLTQMTLGFSRDDASKFIHHYQRHAIFEKDPFESIDQNGVGALMKLAKKLGRGVNPNLKLGICGEHGGEPNSIMFCQEIGLDYVSCSPYRVPIAILAAAQAVIKLEMKC